MFNKWFSLPIFSPSSSSFSPHRLARFRYYKRRKITTWNEIYRALSNKGVMMTFIWAKKVRERLCIKEKEQQHTTLCEKKSACCTNFHSMGQRWLYLSVPLIPYFCVVVVLYLSYISNMWIIIMWVLWCAMLCDFIHMQLDIIREMEKQGKGMCM